MVDIQWGVLRPLVTPLATLASLWAEAPLYDLTISLSHCSITAQSVNPIYGGITMVDTFGNEYTIIV